MSGRTRTFAGRAEHQDRLVDCMFLEMRIQLVVEAFLELKLVRLLARVSVDEAFQLARSEFFAELQSGVRQRQDKRRQMRTVNVSAAASKDPVRPIHAAISPIFGAVAETRMKRTAVPRSFMRAMHTSRVLPRDSLRI